MRKKYQSKIEKLSKVPNIMQPTTSLWGSNFGHQKHKFKLPVFDSWIHYRYS